MLIKEDVVPSVIQILKAVVVHNVSLSELSKCNKCNEFGYVHSDYTFAIGLL